MTGVQVAAGQWRDHHAALRGEGGVLETLTVVDRGADLEVITVVRRTTGALISSTEIPADAPAIASLASELPAAAWLEREAAEMFGVEFTEHPDPRPLLLRDAPPTPPLRRATPLVERLDVLWPGARVVADRAAPHAARPREVNDGKRTRRPALPPGVRQEWIETRGDQS